MREMGIAIALLLSFVGTAAPQAKQQAAALKAASPPLEASVRKLWEAFKNKDKATLSSLIDDQFRMFEEGLSTFADKRQKSTLRTSTSSSATRSVISR